MRSDPLLRLRGCVLSSCASISKPHDREPRDERVGCDHPPRFQFCRRPVRIAKSGKFARLSPRGNCNDDSGCVVYTLVSNRTHESWSPASGHARQIGKISPIHGQNATHSRRTTSVEVCSHWLCSDVTVSVTAVPCATRHARPWALPWPVPLSPLSLTLSLYVIYISDASHTL